MLRPASDGGRAVTLLSSSAEPALWLRQIRPAARSNLCIIVTVDTLTCPNLIRLFERITPFAGPDGTNALRHPEPRSSLAGDEIEGSSFWLITLIAASFTAGVSHVYTLQRTTLDLKLIGTHAPYALLRSALESFVQAAWLLDGPTRDERRLRALRMYAHDLDERRKWENEIGRVPPPPAKSGKDREKDVIELGVSMGWSEAQIKRRPTIVGMIEDASKRASFPAGEPKAAWRAASGFAHGRLWPNLGASEATAVALLEGGAWVKTTIDERKLDELAKWCDRFLERAIIRFSARAQAPY